MVSNVALPSNLLFDIVKYEVTCNGSGNPLTSHHISNVVELKSWCGFAMLWYDSDCQCLPCNTTTEIWNITPIVAPATYIYIYILQSG